MKELLRKLIPDSVMDVYRLFRQVRYDNHYKEVWLTNGKKGTAPYSIKQQTIKDFAHKFQVKIFIETGTLYGDMIHYCQDAFVKLYTIELSKHYFRRAKNRFRNYSHISVLEGDSAIILPQVLKSISEKTLFWLDGHFSGSDTASNNSSETPISEEIVAVLGHGNEYRIKHVILVDDARCFDGTKGYPTIDDFKKQMEKIAPTYAFEIENDIVRIY